ncbi:MAG: hypothetical protein FRX48_07449 [Lasallia pustulata]|uniref:Uncharacterized protein n=1 Tax=Lasallia pustulata TaxID=136370 RepID=A0A5M8PIG2_9LECA|nr:MAG: hypothetical protein FRX48_07449 [Lasallia pustulata]
MKKIALITVLFLPGTFVATLFYMSMFDWKRSPSPSSITTRPQVSLFLWIYWVITVPFTLFVLLAWRIWWKSEDRIYQEELKRVGAQHNSSNPPKI